MGRSIKEILSDLLRTHRRVTLRMMFEAGIAYSGRNRIAELRQEGWVIETYHHNLLKGETASDNAYILVSAPRTVFHDPQFQEENGQVFFV